MSGKLLWSGLTLVVGLPPILSALNLPSALVVLLGGLLMVVGAILLLLEK